MNKINKLSKKDYESLIKELIEAYDTYVKVLEVENGSLVGFAYTHGWRSSLVKFGEKCRADIQELKSKIRLGE